MPKAKQAQKPQPPVEPVYEEPEPRIAEIISAPHHPPIREAYGESQERRHMHHAPPPQVEESDETVKKCPECGGSNLIRDYERGEIICRTCGLVITDALTDFGPEWRAFDSEQKDKRARTGGPTKLMRPNKGLVTEIDQYNKDIRGAKIDSKLQAQLHRMRKWHKRISIASSFEKNLAIALGELDRVASSLGLPDNIKENIAALYRKAVKSELIRGRLIESVVAAVIYAACRIYGIPRTLDEISKISGVEKKEIGRAYRFLKKELELDIPLTDPSAYVPKFAVVLNLSRDVQMMAIEIIKKSLKKGLISGRGPTGVAAAALYIAAAMKNEKRTQKEVADVAGVTEVTIRNRYRELKKELDIDINL
jgi:transcription initiation factor TFIIB